MSQVQAAEGASRSQAQAADEGVSRSQTQAAEVGAFRSQAQVPARKNDVALRSDAQIAHEGHTFNTRSKQEGVELYRLRADAEVFVPSGFPSEPPGHEGESASSPGVKAWEWCHNDSASRTSIARVDEDSEGQDRSPMPREQREKWLSHIRAGHWPYRKDCQVCVRGSAVGLQHRKSKYKDSHVLSYDISGPFPEIGRSFDATGYRYLLVAGYRVPSELLRLKGGEATKEPSKAVQEEPVEVSGPSVLPLTEEEDKEPLLLPNPAETQTCDEDLEGSVDFGEEGVPDPEEEEIPLQGGVEQSILSGNVEDSDLDEYLRGLQEPIPQEVLRFAVPLKTRSPKGVLEGLQQICGEVHRLGLPVHRLHTDREGASDSIKKWCYQNLIVPSYTQGQDPQANGLAERLVRWFKCRMRTNLSSSDLPVKFWPLAAQHAAQSHLLRSCGKPDPPFFGQAVWFKGKTPTSKPKRVFEKWERGRYLTPSTCDTEGHWILRESSKAILSTRNLRANLVHPEKVLAKELPELVAENEVDGVEAPLMSPYHRISSKGPDPLCPDLPIASAVQVDMSLEEAELRAQVLLHKQDFRPSAAAQVLNMLGWSGEVKASRGDADGYELFGVFRHGGIQGISRTTRRLPSVTAYLNAYLWHHQGHRAEPKCPSWTSFVVYANPQIQPHVDHRNAPETENYVLSVPGQTCLWTLERLSPQSTPAGDLSPE